MKLNDAVDLFVMQLEADGRSPHTVRQYRRHCRVLAAWLGAEHLSAEVEGITPAIVARFLSSAAVRTRQDGKARRATSANSLRTSVRCLFAFLSSSGITPTNPARLVKRARCSPPPPRGLSPEEERRLLAVLDQATGVAAARDRVVVRLLLGVGLRIGSAVGLDIEDVDLATGELRVRTAKNDRPALFFLPEGLRPTLAEHIGARTSGPLFQSRGGGRVCVRQVQRRVECWLEAAGVQGEGGCHRLRHSFAISLLARTGNLALVQRALGHSAIASTVTYARTSDLDLRRALGA